jgi:subtilisin family serine protease
MLGLIVWSAAALAAAAQPGDGVVNLHASGDYHPTRLLVRFNPGVTPARKQVAHSIARAGRVVKEYRIVPDLQVVEVPEGDLNAVLNAYKIDPAVRYVERNVILYAVETPNDASFGQLWGLRNTGQDIGPTNDPGTPGADIRATQAWDFWTGDPDFRIAVIDSGVDYNHPDLQANIWTNPGEIPGNGIDDEGNGYIDDVHGYDFLFNDPDPMDQNYHGTHVAGTIAAVANNGIGVAGVNWQGKIVALRFLSAFGTGPVEDAIECIQYVVDNDIRVSNNSWGGGSSTGALYDAIAAAQADGHLFVAAAGNAGSNADLYPLYPAAISLDSIISVAATDNDDMLASFSNFGPISVDLGAPGANIYSTFPGGGYAYLSGTSMAAPHVTGVAALLMSRRPELNYQQVKDRILAGVRPVSSLMGRTVTGGVLNAANVGDCNGNGTDDEIDIAGSFSLDCTGNLIPDECEPDCNGNMVRDSCEMAGGTQPDCNDNHIPDECEPDCNDNDIPDTCDVADGTSEDCAQDLVPDECEPDCNQNGVSDLCDLIQHTSTDCNDNGIGDECDLNDGTSVDENANGLPDECDAIKYVDAATPDGGDGATWATAYNDLQDALADFGATEYWVAGGVYKPAPPGGDRGAKFEFRGSRRFFGGFAGGETLFTQRNTVAHQTVLSGDLNGDDGPNWTNRQDNTYHVVTVDFVADQPVLSGFTIRGGNADGAPPNDQGGGIYFAIYTRAILENCIFTDNSAVFGGAARDVDEANPIFRQCTFSGNRALDSGGAMYTERTLGVSYETEAVDCVFVDNSAVLKGGAIYNALGDIPLTRCSFTGNSAGEGGALYTASGDPVLAGCRFEGNSATTGGGMFGTGLGNTSTFNDCTFVGNTATGDGGGAYSNADSQMFSRCRFFGNAATRGGAMFTQSGNPTLVNCLLVGNTATSGAAAELRGAADGVWANTTFVSNFAQSFGAAAFIFGTSNTLNFSNCVFQANRTSSGTNQAALFGGYLGDIVVNYSAVQGWTGSLGGQGNFSADPMLVDMDGPDNIAGTEDDDVRLRPGSPCVDAGDNTAAGLGGVTTDLDGFARFVDIPSAVDTGNGSPPIVDIGAYERQPFAMAPDIVWDSSQERTRSVRVQLAPPATATGTEVTSALRVTLLDLENPAPPNNNPAGPCCPPGNFITFDTAVNSVCAGGSDQGYRCPPSTCPGGSCPAAVGCSEPFFAGPPQQGSCARWAGQPLGYLESNDNPGLGNYRASRLQCTPFYHDWGAEPDGGLVNILGAEIIPSSTYHLQTFGADCKGSESSCTNVSPVVQVTTRRAGDIATPYQGAPPLTQPNAIDVTNAVNKFRNLAGSPPKVVSQVQPNFPDPNSDINAIDIVTVVDNVRGFGYTYSGPCICPSTVPCNTTACAGASACTGLYGAGATCIKTCTSGRTGQPCNNNLNCGYCVGGPATGTGAAGIPCDANSDCGSNNCAVGVCPTGATPGFCRDRCGRCN